MTQLVWDKIGDRRFESGLDKGVLYLSDGRIVPWNGLTQVVEKKGTEISPTHYDGQKIQDRVVLGDFEATLKAITYPEEFVEVEGLAKVRRGVYLGDQAPKVFDLCYRTLIGDDQAGEQAGYKLHIVYNLTAVPADKTYATLSLDPSLVEFEWNLTAVPDDAVGFRPTAHIILDSRELDPWLLEDLELKLYGGPFSVPDLPPLPELVSFMDGWYRWKVTDNGDGTYTLLSGRPGMLIFTGDSLEIFQALGIYVVDHGDGSFTVYDTYDVADLPTIDIINNGDGTWSATSNQDNLITVDETGYFEIFNANAVMIAVDTYALSDTEE